MMSENTFSTERAADGSELIDLDSVLQLWMLHDSDEDD